MPGCQVHKSIEWRVASFLHDSAAFERPLEQALESGKPDQAGDLGLVAAKPENRLAAIAARSPGNQTLRASDDGYIEAADCQFNRGRKPGKSCAKDAHVSAKASLQPGSRRQGFRPGGVGGVIGLVHAHSAVQTWRRYHSYSSVVTCVLKVRISLSFCCP